MGTSVSQSSKRNSNWRPVLACYQNANIPQNRVINEIWRASDNEETSISKQLKSPSIYSCFLAVKDSTSYQEALGKYNKEISESKNNTIIAEFAKRVLPIAFVSEKPTVQWSASFFSEVTTYIMSRDASAFVSETSRNKTVKELISFKQEISKAVKDIVTDTNVRINSKSEWNSFVDKTIKRLKKG
jgi:hypothetical protein